MTYTPKPGTNAYRALVFLQEHPGSECTISTWADASGVPFTSMQKAVDQLLAAGLVEKFQKHGQSRPAWYRAVSVGDPVEPEIQPAVHDQAALHTPSEGGEAAYPPATTKRQEADHAEGRSASAVSFRCALWSDGTLTVEHDGDTVLFTAADVAVLRRSLCGGAAA